MKRAYSVALVVLLALAGLLTGCSMPDYQLDFSDISINSISGNYANVSYTLRNTGSKDLKNVSIQITIESDDDVILGSDWTSEANIGAGSSTTSNISIYVSGTGLATSYLHAYATQAVWDDENSSSIF